METVMEREVVVNEVEAQVGENVFDDGVKTTQRDINMDVERLVREVPAYHFEGPIMDVAADLKEFEDGFCFVPVQRPLVEGDYYLANTYNAADPTVLPEYSQTSDHYRLLRSHETLKAIGEALGDHLHVKAVVQKSISVALFDKRISEDTPIIYYLNSYNRSTREKIILGFALLAFNYLHRRSGEQRDDFENIMAFMSDDSYVKGTQLLRDYPVSFKEFRSLTRKIALPLKRIAHHMFGISREVWKTHDDEDTTEEFMYQIFKDRYQMDDERKSLKLTGDNSNITDTPNVLNLVSFMHDVYHFHTANERFDVATRMLDNVSDYMTKRMLPSVKFSELI